MERFVMWVSAGGVSLVGGLWLLADFAQTTPAWVLGAGLTALGTFGLLSGIGERVEGVPPRR